MDKRHTCTYTVGIDNYIYDANSNKITMATDNRYPDDSSIKTSYKNNTSKIETDKSIMEKIMHPAIPYVNIFLERKVGLVVLQLTQDCNFRCSYCPYTSSINNSQRRHSNKYMSIETGTKSIDFLHDRSTDIDVVTVGFYGGEPLLSFDVLKYLVEYAKKKFIGKELIFNMTTNGSLLNPEIIDHIVENKFLLIISLDGPQSINDKNRVFAHSNQSTYNSVIRNLKYLVKKYPFYAKKNLQINMVMDPRLNYDEYNSIFDTWPDAHDYINIRTASLEFDYYEKDIKFNDDFYAKQEYTTFLYLMKEISKYTGKLPITADGIMSSIEQIEKRLSNEAKPIHKTDCPSGNCIPGSHKLLIDVDGSFFPCERVPETSKDMKIGNLTMGFDVNKIIRLLNIAEITYSECSNCWAFRLCFSCFKYSDVGKGIDRDARLHHCKIVRADLLYRLKVYTFLSSIRKNKMCII